MCRILGITNFDYNTHFEILNNFIGLAETGNILPNNTPGHIDGWGIGYYRNNKPVIIKSGNSILKEKEKALNVLKKINKTGALIFHLRKSAWKNTNSNTNSHPFACDKIILGHNGTIYDYKKLLSLIKGGKKLGKSLDSEVYLRFICSNLKNNIVQAFSNSVKFIKQHNNHSSLTCIFSDGKKMYSFREYTRYPGYYTLYSIRINKSSIVCSEPVSDKLNWKVVKPGKLNIVGCD